MTARARDVHIAASANARTLNERLPVPIHWQREYKEHATANNMIPILDQMTIVIKHVGERKRQNPMVGRCSTSNPHKWKECPQKAITESLGKMLRVCVACMSMGTDIHKRKSAEL